MGYSGNEAAINRVKPLLDQMVTATSDLSWPTDNAHMFGYYIREAMNLAKNKQIEPYHLLKDSWIIRNKGTKVVAEKRGQLNIVALQEAMNRMEVPEIHSVEGVVGAAIMHKAHQMYFPDTVLSDENALMLYRWCQKNSYFLVVAEVGVTLTKDDPGEAAWTPDQ